jgi:acetyl-CoA carboxylase biotin carboxyl carrier protein
MAKAQAAKAAKTSASAAGSAAARSSKADTATMPRPSGGIDTDLVRSIANLLAETNVGEIEIKKGDLKIRVSRQVSAAAAPAPVAMTAPAAAAPAPAPAPAATPPSQPVAVAAHPGAVKSPMVGTAYRKPSPDAKNFVEVGSVVKAGDKLMLIEAMKTFNDIVAPKSGLVSAILVEDGQPVEFGQTLFVIE